MLVLNKFKILVLGLVLSGCGGQAYSTPSTQDSTIDPSRSSGSGGSGSGSGSALIVPSDSDKRMPPLQFSFHLQRDRTVSVMQPDVAVGTYTTRSFNTDNLLKVTLRADEPSNVPLTASSETIYKAVYSCLQVRVTVGSHSKDMMVAYGAPSTGPCAGASPTVSEDFSDQAYLGHGALNISVSNPGYDNCYGVVRNGYVLGPQNSGCGAPYYSYNVFYFNPNARDLRGLLSDHIVNGTLIVETNRAL